MTKTLLLSIILLFFSACVNKHGVSAKYYSNCDEYYDVQGYYHKECGKDDIFTYKGLKDGVVNATKNSYNYINGTKEKPKGNVW